MTATPRFAKHLALLLCLSVLAAGCEGCQGGGTGSVTAGFRTTTTELDFGKVLEGAEVTRALELTGTGRGDVTVVLEVEGPFRAPGEVQVPAGGTVGVDVTFTAPDGEATGTLRLSARNETFEVALKGRGVRPLQCIPSAQCRVSRFVLETEQCEEAVAPDDALCTPEGRCLENGICRAGACVGTPRVCDDANACTQDACAPDVGCIHLDVSSACPAPMNPCEVATCDPVQGCGTEQRDDLTVCGSVDCVTANLCQSGQCRPLPTPEGFLCAPKTPCQGEGHCSGGQCVRPDAGEMVPSWSVILGDAPQTVAVERGRILSLGGNIYFASCELASQDGGCALLSYTSNGFQRFEEPLPSDGGVTLHAVAPAGVLVQFDGMLRALALGTGQQLWGAALGDLAGSAGPDGGAPVLPRDALAIDVAGGLALAVSWETAPPSDGGIDDGGFDDGGSDDAGFADGGLDDGGFADGGFDDAGSTDAGPFVPEPLQGLTWVIVDPDGGVVRAEFLADGGFGSSVALGALGRAWLHSAGAPVLTRGTLSADGGVPEWEELPLSTPVDGPLSVGFAGERAFLASAWMAEVDGGVTPLLVPADAGVGELSVGHEVLAANGEGYVFFRACRTPQAEPCPDSERSTMVRAFSLATGLPLWEAKVLPGDVEGTLVEAALPGGPLSQTVMTLTGAVLEGERRADLQLFAFGKRVMHCPLQGEVEPGAALFESNTMYVLVSRGGKWKLEAYDLAGIPLSAQGWMRSRSSAGGRRER